MFFFLRKKVKNLLKTYLCHYTKPSQLENKKFLPIKFQHPLPQPCQIDVSNL